MFLLRMMMCGTHEAFKGFLSLSLFCACLKCFDVTHSDTNMNVKNVLMFSV